MSTRIPLCEPDLRGREADYLMACVRDNWVSSTGPFVDRLEAQMAAVAGCGHAVATVNGTAALHLALVVAGVEPCNRVIVADWTFIASANAIRHAGAEPVFADVDLDSWTLDPEAVKALLEDDADKTIRAVVAVHAIGHPANMDALLPLCREADVPLIEDAAGAIGSYYKGRPVGGLGDLGVFSFNGNKLVTAGGGGVVTTNRHKWAEEVRHLSTQARTGIAYEHDQVGYNYRMTNLNAAVGIAQIERLEEMVAAKQAIAAQYDKALAAYDNLEPMPRADWVESNCWLYTLLVATAGQATSLLDHLAARQIDARPGWHSLSSQPAFSAFAGAPCETSAALTGRTVSLPCSSHLNQTDQDRVIDAVVEWCGE